MRARSKYLLVQYVSDITKLQFAEGFALRNSVRLLIGVHDYAGFARVFENLRKTIYLHLQFNIPQTSLPHQNVAG